MSRLARAVRPRPGSHGSRRTPDTSYLSQVTGWEPNLARGCSYLFGPEVVAEFLRSHGLDLVCRAHQASLGKPLGGYTRWDGVGPAGPPTARIGEASIGGGSADTRLRGHPRFPATWGH